MPMLIYGKKHPAQQSFQNSIALIQSHSTHMVLKSIPHCINNIKISQAKTLENRNTVNQKVQVFENLSSLSGKPKKTYTHPMQTTRLFLVANRAMYRLGVCNPLIDTSVIFISFGILPLKWLLWKKLYTPCNLCHQLMWDMANIRILNHGSHSYLHPQHPCQIQIMLQHQFQIAENILLVLFCHNILLIWGLLYL